MSSTACVPPPLSGTDDCNGGPIEVADQFYHYSINIQSHDALCLMLDSFDGTLPDEYGLHPGGWSEVVRPEALQAFVMISDDGVLCSWNGLTFRDGDSTAEGQQVAVDFDTALRGLSPLHFGADGARDYVFFSLVGLEAPGRSRPLTPTDPVVEEVCTPGAVAPGTAYQWLSKGTDVDRYALCGLSEFDTIFTQMMQQLVDRVAVQCSYYLPPSPPGETADFDSLRVEVVPATGEQVLLARVADPAACAADSYYLEGESLRLCPETCSMGDDDPIIEVRVHYDCL